MRRMKAVRPLFRMAACVCALTTIVVVTGCGGAASRFGSHMSRGQKYYAAGDFSHAGIEFRNAMQIDPKSAVALKMLGHTTEKLGRIREAAGLYQAAIDLVPDDPEPRADLGRLFVFGGAADRALGVVEPGLAKHPDDVGLLTTRGAAWLQQNRVEEARKDADHALRLAPNSESAISLRAAVYQREGDVAGATKFVTAAVDRIPGTTELREVLVSLNVAAGDLPKAESRLKELVALKPRERHLREELAVFYSRSHRLDDAQRTLEEAVRVSDNDDAKLALAEFMASERDLQQADRVLRAYVSAAPENTHLKLGLAELLQRHGAAKEAREVYLDVVRIAKTSPDGLLARDRMAASSFAEGKEEEARRLIAEVLDKSPRDNDALMLRAQMAFAHDDPGAAIVDLRSVLRDQPTSAAALHLLARAHLANDQPALAEQALRTVLEVQPKDTLARNQLARVLIELQHSDQAIQLMENAVRGDPQNAETREFLIRTLLASKEFARARVAAEDLKVLVPRSPAAYYLEAMADQGNHQLEAAQSELEQARVVQPGSIQILTELVRLHLAAHRSEPALQLIQNALDHDIDAKDVAAVAAAENLQGEVYLAAREPTKAIVVLERAAQRAPGWVPPRRNLAAAKLAAGDVAGAIDAYKLAVQTAPGDSTLVTEFALLLERQGRIDEAIAQYEDALRRKPRLQLVANNLAMLLVTYKRDQHSLDRARDLTASMLSSQDGTYLDTTGWVHFKRGEYSQALPVLEKAAQRVPASKEVRYHLAMAEMQAGLTERARNNLQSALAGAGQYPWANEARIALAALKQKTG